MLNQFIDIATQKLRAKRMEYFGKHPDVYTKMYAYTRSNLIKALECYPYYPKIEKSNATEVTIDGKQKIMLGSNNYLGLTNHPKVIEAGVKALQEYGSGLTCSRLLNGNTLLHDQLEEKLAFADPRYPRFIVTDGVFSMEGDIARLDELAALSKKYPSRLMVDDAHSFWVLGPHGDGTAAHFGVTANMDLIMGTFSKSLGCIGGFIAGEKMVIEYLKHHSRTMIFTASLPPSNVASVTAALEIIKAEPERREQVMENAEFVRNGLKSLGFDIGESTTPIIPIVIGKDLKTFQVWKNLMDAGVYTNPIISPAVPQGRALLRTSYMATHTRKQLEFCLDMFGKVGRKACIIR